MLLHWWTFYSSITTKNTTITFFWFYDSLAIFAIIKVLAGISRHFFFSFKAAVRTGDHRINQYIHSLFVLPGRRYRGPGTLNLFVYCKKLSKRFCFPDAFL